jgi:hypothetical protein
LKAIFADDGLGSDVVGFLAPEQLAVFVKGGPTKLIFAVRELLDARPDFCAVNIDLENAFNSIRRSSLLDAVLANEQTEVLGRLLHAVLAPKSLVFGGSGEFVERLEGILSEEGVQQGSIEGMVAFAIGISKALKTLDAELRAGCQGTARAGADDVTAVGTPAVVSPAASRFTASPSARQSTSRPSSPASATWSLAPLRSFALCSASRTSRPFGRSPKTPPTARAITGRGTASRPRAAASAWASTRSSSTKPKWPSAAT